MAEESNPPKITVIAVTYDHPIPTLNRFVSSLQCQSFQDFRCYMIHDGPLRKPSMEELYDKINISDDNRFTIIETEERKGYWGHFNRQWAINVLPLAEFTHLTNADNMYLPNCFEIAMQRLSQGNDIVYWDFLHSYFEYIKFNAQFEINHCDFVNFVVRSSLLKEVGFNHPLQFAADGLLINDLAAATNKINKIDGPVLSIHC